MLRVCSEVLKRGLGYTVFTPGVLKADNISRDSIFTK